MGLIELCLLSLLSPQEPAGTAAPGTTATPPTSEQAPAQPDGAATQDPQPETAAPPPVVQDPVKALQAAEQAGAECDPQLLLALATGEHPEVAARAAWLLGNNESTGHQLLVPKVFETSPHAGARLQALLVIHKTADVGSTTIAIEALKDADRRVRTVAAKMLGKLRRPAAIEPLLSMLKRECTVAESGPATDVQAALLTLTDLGTSQHLLRMSTAVGDGKAEGTGEALAFAFQSLSPQLGTDDEITTLVAVLDHKETLLRRYAIQRLTTLGSQRTIRALESRLGKEGDELRPLLEIAINQIRHDGRSEPQDEFEKAMANADVLWTRFQSWWRKQDIVVQSSIAGGPVLLLMLIWLMRRSARRRAEAAEAQALVEMVQPSDEYSDEDDDYYDEEAAGDDEYYEDEEGDDYDEGYDEGDYADGEEEEAFDEEGEQYDTSGWDDDSEEAVAVEGDLSNDERFR